MANGINRIFDIIHNTSEETNPTTSKTITMTVKSTQPLIFERDDKLEITEDFCIFDNLIDKTTFSVGDMVTAFVFSIAALTIEKNFTGKIPFLTS